MFWETVSLAFTKAWSVLWVGLLFGAGLPVIFALGVRSLAIGGADADGKSTAAGKALSVLFFALIVGAVALGITMIVASGMGKAVSFEHVIPLIVDKKK